MINISNHSQWQAFANSLSKGKKQHCYLLWSHLSLVKEDVHVTRDKGRSSNCTERRQQWGSSRRTALTQGQGQALPCCGDSHPGCSGCWLITRQTKNKGALSHDDLALRYLLVKEHLHPPTNPICQEHMTPLVSSIPVMTILSLGKFSDKLLPLLAQLNL